jgi:hypothetical protein
MNGMRRNDDASGSFARTKKTTKKQRFCKDLQREKAMAPLSTPFKKTLDIYLAAAAGD